MLEIRHDVVRGRVRYKVKGLYRSNAVKIRLEELTLNNPELKEVYANPLTGNVLVIYDPDCNPRLIAALIEKVILDFFRSFDRGYASGPVGKKTKIQDYLLQKRLFRDPKIAKSTTDGVVGEPQENIAWHLMSAKAVLAKVHSSPQTGLSKAAIFEHLKLYGRNVVAETPPRSSVQIFIDQLNSLPVVLLLAAAGLSLATGGFADALVIMAVVGINAVIGFTTESQAEKTINALKLLVRMPAQVIREGELREIPAEEVLVGDIMLLKPGSQVTADGRVLESRELTVDESALTGESLPILKNRSTLRKRKIALADRVNMVYSGTLVTGGSGLAVVVATGRFSAIGKIKRLVGETESPPTPIEKQLETLGNNLVLMSGAICGVVFLVGLFRGHGLVEMLKISISLAVAAVPEGLPAVATTTLAFGVHRLRQNKVIIRNLDAICTMGAVQTICFDKTGTITHNRMAVTRLYSGQALVEVREGSFVYEAKLLDVFEDDGLMMIIRVCVLCNESSLETSNGDHVLTGSATENALIHMAIEAGVNVRSLRSQHPAIETLYRSESRQFMETVHEWDREERLFAIKGNPEEVLSKCGFQLNDGGIVPLTDDDRDSIEAQNDDMAGDALRVLGLAYATRKDPKRSQEENGFVWLGLVGLADPIREQAKRAVKVFHQAGIETVMITGDQASTAYAVGRELGLNNGKPLEVMDARNLSEIEPSLTRALARRTHVFARVSPANKLQIVQALQKDGRVVAMTGDGINDGPALKAADVGIAMGGSKCDMAREVADAVLEEDDLETLVVAVRDGRTIYSNIKKTLHYLLATNFSEIQVMFVSGAVGLGYPLNAMQLLWINLVSDIFPGLALALEPPEPDVMNKPPLDPTEPIIQMDDLKRIIFEAGLMSSAAMVAYTYGITRYGAGGAASTLAFQTLSTAQILHALTCRSETGTLFRSGKRQSNQYLNMAMVGSLLLQGTTFLFPGLRSLLGLARLTLLDGLVIGATSVVPLLITETRKLSQAGEHE